MARPASAPAATSTTRSCGPSPRAAPDWSPSGWRRNPEPDLAVWTSPDGASPGPLPPDPEGFAGYEATDVVDLDGTLVMVGSSFTGEGGRIWFSDDGFTWEPAEVAGGMDGAYAREASRRHAGRPRRGRGR